jgi:hypothetical protein
MAKRRIGNQCQLKVGNLPNLGASKRHATYRWKDFNKGYNFALNLISIGGFHKKLWASKMTKVLILGILEFLTRKSQDKWHLGVTLVVNHKECYNGEGDGFP